MDRRQKKQNHIRRGNQKLRELSLLCCARGRIKYKAPYLKHVAAAAGQISSNLSQQRRIYKEFCLDHFPSDELADCMNYFKVELRDESVILYRRWITKVGREFVEYRKKFSGKHAASDLKITHTEATALNLEMLIPREMFRQARWQRMSEDQIRVHRQNQTRAATQAQVDRSERRQSLARHLHQIGYTIKMISDKCGVGVRSVYNYLRGKCFVELKSRSGQCAITPLRDAKSHITTIKSVNKSDEYGFRLDDQINSRAVVEIDEQARRPRAGMNTKNVLMPSRGWIITRVQQSQQ